MTLKSPFRGVVIRDSCYHYHYHYHYYYYYYYYYYICGIIVLPNLVSFLEPLKLGNYTQIFFHFHLSFTKLTTASRHGLQQRKNQMKPIKIDLPSADPHNRPGPRTIYRPVHGLPLQTPLRTAPK